MTSGEQILDFVPIASVTDHLLAACSRDDIAAGIPLIVNIGTGVGVRLVDFASDEWARFGAVGKLRINSLPSRLHDVRRSVADLSGLHSSSLPKN